MADLSKTVVVQVLPDGATTEVLERLGRESAKWMTKAFKTLYSDKRNYHWTHFGPDKPWDKKGRCIPRWKPKAERWDVVGEMLYPAFVGKASPHRIFSTLPATTLQVLSQKVAVVWGNFLNADIPRPKSHKGRPALPYFSPISMFHAMSEKFSFSATGFTMELSHPYKARETLMIASVDSRDERFMERLALIQHKIDTSTWSAIEIKKHEDGKWYLHISVSISAAEPVRQPSVVTGIDVGVANVMTTSTVTDKTGIPASTRVRGSPIFHRLERIQARMRRLRSKADRGDQNARRKLKRLKGQKTNVQQTMTRQIAAEVVKIAVANAVQGIAVEDLRKMRKPGLGRRMNRLVTNWARGEARDFMEFKAKENGLNFKEVPAAGTSRTCPACGHNEKENRNGQKFKCLACGFARNADDVGSINIARRGWADWNSPKWKENDKSRSTCSQPAGASGGEASGVGNDLIGETFNPQNNQTDGTNPTPAMANCAENPMNSAIGTAHAATSRGRLGLNPKPSQNPERHRKRDIPERASGDVTRGVPEGARTDDKQPKNGTGKRAKRLKTTSRSKRGGLPRERKLAAVATAGRTVRD